MTTTTQRNERAPGWAPWRRSLWYHWAVYTKTWRGSVVSSVMFPILYLASLGLGVGHLVSQHTGLVQGQTYLHFVAPGLLAITAMQTASNECMWPVLGAVKWQRNYHAAVTTPLTPEDIVWGKLGFVACRVLATTAFYVVVIACFGAVRSWWAVLLPVVATLTGIAFAAPLMAYSAKLESDAPFAVVYRFLLVPMFLFSATFFPLSHYPVGLRPFVQIMPLYHGVALTRSLAFGIASFWPTVAHVGVLVGMSVLGVSRARRNLHRRLVS